MALGITITVPLRAFSLDLALSVGGEVVALVGPSGAGKTTVLRAVAGLAPGARGRITAGDEVWLDSEAGVDLSPEDRAVGFLFQDLALFPHMTVAENVGFADPRRAADLLERFGIAHLARARPAGLSGGERRRVALARSLARAPRALLLDEPTAGLDVRAAAAIRAELREHTRAAGVPTLLVTHDFHEAAALADRVGVIVEGRLLQEGRPEELVAAPRDPFVASLAGGNVLPGTARPGPDGLTLVALDAGGEVRCADPGAGRVGVVVRPEEVAVARARVDDSALNQLEGEVGAIVPLGNRVRVSVGPVVAEVTAASADRLGLARGGRAVAAFKATGARLVALGR